MHCHRQECTLQGYVNLIPDLSNSRMTGTGRYFQHASMRISNLRKHNGPNITIVTCQISVSLHLNWYKSVHEHVHRREISPMVVYSWTILLSKFADVGDHNARKSHFIYSCIYSKLNSALFFLSKDYLFIIKSLNTSCGGAKEQISVASSYHKCITF